MVFLSKTFPLNLILLYYDRPNIVKNTKTAKQKFPVLLNESGSLTIQSKFFCPMRLIQLFHKQGHRRLALVQGDDLVLILNYTTAYDLACAAIDQQKNPMDCVGQNLSDEKLPYEGIYDGRSEWKILHAFDHPINPRYCMLSGTGLTHKASAENRQKMHELQEKGSLTDSMIMYQWGLEGGKPANGRSGVQPEWFYKGNGSQLRGHLDPLVIPSYGLDGGEEPEIAGIYVNDEYGNPHRIGFATANEFSDHAMEKKNYLWLAPSKIRNCSLGPELSLSQPFKSLSGKVSIARKGKTLWEKTIHTGEDHITHSLENLEYHHFKYDNHRLPWDVHIHFFGADAFSYGAGIELEHGDLMSIQWEGMGRALVNPLHSTALVH